MLLKFVFAIIRLYIMQFPSPDRFLCFIYFMLHMLQPIWVLKTANERSMQRFVGLSADLARQVGVMLENLQHVTAGQVCYVLLANEHFVRFDPNIFF